MFKIEIEYLAKLQNDLFLAFACCSSLGFQDMSIQESLSLV